MFHSNTLYWTGKHPNLYCTNIIFWVQSGGKIENRVLKHNAVIVHLKFLRKPLGKKPQKLVIMNNPITLDGALASSHTLNISPHLCDAGCSWHIPDNFDSLSLILVRAAERAAHDWHADGQTNSENLKTSCPCHTAICRFLSNWTMSALIGMWAWLVNILSPYVLNYL